ncbi:MAG: peptidase M14 [Haliscomenobacter sp.]|nr:peptidase M14 [Haliscomenobacter sp.]
MQQFISVWVLVLGIAASSCGQAPPLPPLSVNADPLYKNHPQYREGTLTTKRFKHEEIVPLIAKLPAPLFQVQTVGKSMEGRTIYHIKTGNGPVTVLLWSQMHGDESTATMALFDIFNFLQRSDELNPLRELLLTRLNIHFIPMLNPDGAERFTRRNVQDIDINRDAQRLVTPEGQILKRVRDSLSAQWGFNLHDQSRYYAAGTNPKTASISFLAPAYNVEKEINDVRGNAMRLIAMMNRTLQQYIPERVARYDDTHEPRAFGDNIQKWGTSTILIESGGLPNDPEKQELRRLNFVSILTALEGIAQEVYSQYDFTFYDALPFNESNAFHDLILRETEVQRNGRWYKVDLAFRRDEVPVNNFRYYYYRGSISEVGDLSTSFGYEEFRPKGTAPSPAKCIQRSCPMCRNSLSSTWRPY